MLIVIAHPDDEAMFFLPTIHALQQELNEVYLLCLSNGDAAGLGRIREKELQESARFLGLSGCEVLNDPLLPDSMVALWDPRTVGLHVVEYLQTHQRRDGRQFDMIITFDKGGVSGHLNHIALE